MPHPADLPITLLSYAPPCWPTQHPPELFRFYWATPPPIWATPLLSYASPYKFTPLHSYWATPQLLCLNAPTLSRFLQWALQYSLVVILRNFSLYNPTEPNRMLIVVAESYHYYKNGAENNQSAEKCWGCGLERAVNLLMCVFTLLIQSHSRVNVLLSLWRQGEPLRNISMWSVE